MINGKTKIIGIIGDPIEHTLSPIIHNSAFREMGLNYCYVPFHVRKERLKEAIYGIKALNIKGLNITIPHKEEVLKYLDKISDEARYIGAVNTIINEDGLLIGFNTDTFGFIMSLKEENVKIKNRQFLVIGAGGASKAVLYGILKEGGDIFLFNRTISKAFKIKDDFKALGEIKIVEKIEKTLLDTVQIIVNTTSLGLKPDDPMPIEPSFLNENHTFCDIVYPETPLMIEARKIGCKVIGGLGMLLWQAAKAFEIWTGYEAPIEVMKKSLILSK